MTIAAAEIRLVARNHAVALAVGVLVVFMVVAGSLRISADLNTSMLPATEHTNMQMHY